MTQVNELQEKIKSMAVRQEAPGNYIVNENRYKLTLHDMAYEDELSYPVYLLLSYCWNDALNWADNPESFVMPNK